MLARLLLFVLVCGSSAALATEQPGPFLFDLMKQDAYAAAWKGMLAGETVPEWVESYGKTLDGPAMPALTVAVSDESYKLGFTCKPNDCGDNQLFVLFAPGAKQAWGLLITGDKHRWLGSPDPTIRAAILSGVE